MRKGLHDFYWLAQKLPREEYVILIVGKVLDEKHNVLPHPKLLEYLESLGIVII